MKRKWLASILVIAMVCTSVAIAPKQAQAAETASDIVYLGSEDGYDFSKYWSATTKTAPIKDGYVFGGWYADDQGADPLTEAEAASAETAYAKFVPAYVLSVKAQVDDATKEAEDGVAASLRLISSVDSKNYAKVGFRILLSNNIEYGLGDRETEKIYTGLISNGKTITPQQIFGAKSSFLSVWRLDGIIDDCDAEIIYVQPYWVTMDGTKVTGLAKFVHVEDSYMNYVSVPINLTTGEAVAAGTLDMKYESSVLTVKDVEYGNVFDKMADNKSEVGKIKFVGNASVVNQKVNANDIYANVRFTINDSAEYEGSGSGEFLNFTINNEVFCDWEEELVQINAWDVVY